MNFAPKRAKTRPPRVQTKLKPGPKWDQKGHNMNQKGAKMSTKDTKGAPNVTPKSDKNTTKNPDLEKGRSWGGARIKFWDIFQIFLFKKCVQKSMRKTMPKNMSTNSKIKQKTRHDPTP